jgi:hypothetical protein
MAITMCGCCRITAATGSRALSPGKIVATCGACQSHDLRLPRRRDAVGECASWFYGYVLLDGSLLRVPADARRAASRVSGSRPR